jgi:geranylgeranyl diphosphate synthase type 3
MNSSQIQYALNFTLQALLEPFTYITSNPGKEMRTHLIEAFNLWLNVPPEKLKVIARIVNMLHAASLMYAC